MATYTFDGANKLIILQSGSLDVQDMYSRWKEWVAAGTNMKFLQALRVVGGDETVLGNTIANYFFLVNGWKIRPMEANHTLNVEGILLVEGGGDPFANTVGIFRVRIVQVIPLQAEGVATSGGGSGPSAEAIASAVWNHTQ